eukprot:8357404-Pyramimonas_sp.AAC.1
MLKLGSSGANDLIKFAKGVVFDLLGMPSEGVNEHLARVARVPQGHPHDDVRFHGWDRRRLRGFPGADDSEEELPAGDFHGGHHPLGA